MARANAVERTELFQKMSVNSQYLGSADCEPVHTCHGYLLAFSSQ